MRVVSSAVSLEYNCVVKDDSLIFFFRTTFMVLYNHSGPFAFKVSMSCLCVRVPSTARSNYVY